MTRGKIVRKSIENKLISDKSRFIALKNEII